MLTNAHCSYPGNFLYYRLIFPVWFLPGQVCHVFAANVRVLFNLVYSRNRMNSRRIFFPRWFLWTPLSHSCKHTVCSGLLSCIYTLWLSTKSECLVSQKIVSILWFIRSLWYPRLPLFCTITNYISLSYFDNPSN